MGEHRVLLPLVEPMDLVDEEHGPLFQASALLGSGHDLAEVGDPC